MLKIHHLFAISGVALPWLTNSSDIISQIDAKVPFFPTPCIKYTKSKLNN